MSDQGAAHASLVKVIMMVLSSMAALLSSSGSLSPCPQVMKKNLQPAHTHTPRLKKDRCINFAPSWSHLLLTMPSLLVLGSA